MPVPPDYTACIANLKKHQTTTGPAADEAALKSQCEQQYKSYKAEVMSFLISSEWVIQEANRLGVHLTDQEVQKELEKLRQREFPKEAEFKKFLATSGETISDLLLRVKIDMLGSRIEKKVANGAKPVSASEVEHYYNLHQSQYGKPEAKDLLVILTKTEAGANKAKQEIESGKSFASVAKTSSIDPTSKNTGGKLNGVVARRGAKGIRRRDLLGQGKRPQRTSQDAVRLLRLRSQEDHPGRQGGVVEGLGRNQAPAQGAATASGHDGLPESIPDALEEPDRLS